MEAPKDKVGDVATDDQDTEVAESEELTETMVLDETEAATESSDNVGMSSVQFDAEELVAELESEKSDGVDKDGRLRKCLEAIVERKRREEELADFDDYDIDS
ncbi:MAG: hypothetical protein CL799_07660 [Chromatiales bacterium]|jgi:molecular chaperone GrpE (heat shock protein)|nr:hypothetical protein [Chromatiales bacterium]MDP6151689.1 hypothetical protein [Gammaproteobacteria bacterium]MDP7094505.1 hypothetical protein [Gammaproteobacteria bacterium]MDP7271631.1 hypothetical protein [Gammaproteobacteria bacterium]HJP03636.1 hypothetical protein [Gammaproteobacteria bacterium]